MHFLHYQFPKLQAGNGTPYRWFTARCCGLVRFSAITLVPLLNVSSFWLRSFRIVKNPKKRLKMFHKKPTAGIILAAGMSTRFGDPKQLQKLKDRYLLDWVLDAALSSQLEGLILVLGHHFETICTALGDSLHHPSLKVVNNPHYREGLSTSLRTGVSHIQHDFSSVMFLLADQPLLNSDNIDLLLTDSTGPKKIFVFRSIRAGGEIRPFSAAISITRSGNSQGM